MKFSEVGLWLNYKKEQLFIFFKLLIQNLIRFSTNNARLLFGTAAALVALLFPIFVVHLAMNVWYPWQTVPSHQSLSYEKFQSGSLVYKALYDPVSKQRGSIISEDAFEDVLDAADFGILETLRIPEGLMVGIARNSLYCYSQTQEYSPDPDVPYIKEIIEKRRIELTHYSWNTFAPLGKNNLVPNGDPICVNGRNAYTLHYLHPYNANNEVEKKQIVDHGKNGSVFFRISLDITRKPTDTKYILVAYFIIFGVCWTFILLIKNILLFCFPWIKEWLRKILRYKEK